MGDASVGHAAGQLEAPPPPPRFKPADRMVDSGWVGMRLRVPLVVCVLLGATAAGTLLAWRAADRDLAATRAQRSDQVAASLRSGLLLAAEDVRGIAALFNTQTQVDPDVFAGFVAQPLDNGVIDGAYWAPRVPTALRGEYQRRNGFPIVEAGDQGRVIRAHSRAVYFPATYTAVRRRSSLLSGRDLAVDPTGGTLRAAVAAGVVSATSAVTVAPGAPGLMLFQAIYATVRTPSTAVQRWVQVTGIAAVSVRGDSLVRRALAGEGQPVTMRLSLDGSVLYGGARDPGGSLIRTLYADGRVLRIAVAVSDGGAGRLTAWIVLGAGLALSIVIGLALRRAATREEFGERLVAERTGALESALAAVEQARAVADRLSRRDPVTDAYNRRHLLETLERTLERAARGDEQPAVFLLDVDHFKLVNDAFGHAGGDEALCAVAGIIVTAVRPSDTVARWGGEEFCVLVPDVPNDAAAYRIGESLRQAVEDHAISLEGDSVRVTVSVGCARVAAGRSSAPTLIAAADDALYQAKRAGRNRTEVAAEPVPASRSRRDDPSSFSPRDDDSPTA